MPPAPQAIYLWRSVFAAHGVDIVNFSKLFEAGTWVTLRKGATLQEVGQPCNSVFLIVRGGADNYFEEKYTHSLGDHTFIGDDDRDRMAADAAGCSFIQVSDDRPLGRAVDELLNRAA